MTDGFHLVVEALKLNEVNTIYGVAGTRSRVCCAWRRRKGSATWAFATSSRPATWPGSPGI
jgi:hypothetical protein